MQTISLLATAVITSGATATLAAQAAVVEQWASDRQLQLSAQKSTLTLFSSQTRELNSHPAIPFNNPNLPLEKNPKVLGMTFDPTLTFCAHVGAAIHPTGNDGRLVGLTERIAHKNYKATAISLITCACPIWFPYTSLTNISKLQRVQNAACRITTRSAKLSDERRESFPR